MVDDIERGEVTPVHRRRRLDRAKVLQMREDMEGVPDKPGKPGSGRPPLSVEDAAIKYNLPYFTMYQIRRGWTYKDAGGPVLAATVRKKKIGPKLAKRMRFLHKERGATIDQLCAATGYGRTAVKKALADV